MKYENNEIFHTNEWQRPNWFRKYSPLSIFSLTVDLHSMHFLILRQHSRQTRTCMQGLNMMEAGSSRQISHCWLTAGNSLRRLAERQKQTLYSQTWVSWLTAGNSLRRLAGRDGNKHCTVKPGLAGSPPGTRYDGWGRYGNKHCTVKPGLAVTFIQQPTYLG